jgi:hypothetical protein
MQHSRKILKIILSVRSFVSREAEGTLLIMLNCANYSSPVNVFYPPSQNAPSGRTGMNAKRVSAEALACQKTCLHAQSISMKAGSASRSAKVDMLRRVSPKL